MARKAMPDPGTAVARPAEGVTDETPAFPPIDITVRLWLDAEPEVFSPLSNWLTSDVLARASETQADLDAAKAEDTAEVEIEEGEEE
jgi:hypothetical protein